MNVLQTSSFQRKVKKLHHNQKIELDNAIKVIIDNPYIGDAKVGDLAGVRVYKFKMLTQLVLLAYTFDDVAIPLLCLRLVHMRIFIAI